MITIQNYVRAESLEQAYELNQKKSARILGGMLWLKMAKNTVGTAVDLSGLGLDTIEETGEGFSIGAMVTLRQLEQHPGLNACTGGAFAKALAPIVGVQFRNMATVGGSVWSRFGFSDVLTLLLIRKTPGRVAYEAMRIQRTDLPVLTCAVSDMGGARAVIGARPGKPVVLQDEKGLLAGGVSKESAAAFAADVAARVPMGANSRGSAAYRTHLAEVLTRRCVLGLGGEL